MDSQLYNFIRQQGTTTIENALIDYYSQLNISDQQFVLIVQISRLLQQGVSLPDNQLLARKTHFTPGDVGIIVQSLINDGLMEIVQTTASNNRISNGYSFDLLYEKLLTFVKDNVLPAANYQVSPPQDPAHDELSPATKLIRQFEIEFGRMLSPFERQMLNSWLQVDHYDLEVISLALREAVLAQAYNFKYIDKILLNWQKMNLKTSQQVTNYLQNQR